MASTFSTLASTPFSATRTSSGDTELAGLPSLSTMVAYSCNCFCADVAAASTQLNKKAIVSVFVALRLPP